MDFGKNSKQGAVAKAEKPKKDIKGFFSKLSKGLMLPISLLPAAGIALGVGDAIRTAATDYTFWWYFGAFFRTAGDVVFGNLPLLFAVSIAITFTEDAGAAGLSALVGWLVFNGAQNALIDTGSQSNYQIVFSSGVLDSINGATSGWQVDVASLETGMKEGSEGALVVADSVSGSMTVQDQIDKDYATITFSYEAANYYMSNSSFVDFASANGLAVNTTFDKAYAEANGLTDYSQFYGMTYDANAIAMANVWNDATTYGNLSQIGYYTDVYGQASYKVVVLGQSLVFPSSLFSSNSGIMALNTSVFGGMTIGFVVAFAYNKWNEKQLPPIVGFFSGTRFVLSVTFFMMLPLAIVFLLIWPFVGLGLYYFGLSLGAVPYGFDSLIFGIVERSLIPFGLHHVFYTPLWFTTAGGSIDPNQILVANSGAEAIFTITGGTAGAYEFVANVDTTVYAGTTSVVDAETVNELNAGLSAGTIVAGDTTLGEALGYSANSLGVYDTVGGDQNMWFWVNGAETNIISVDFDWVGMYLDGAPNPGQYMQGKYPFMIFALPAAGLAMIMAAPKGNDREVAASVIVAAAFTAFLTGITEPIEFTFLFLAPWLFWGFHAIMAGFAFMFMDVLGANMGMTFSGGFIDFVLYGIVPQAAGKATDFYWAIAIGVVYMPIYYFVFYQAIVKYDIATPGRGGNEKLYTKADYKAKGSSDAGDEQRTLDVVDALGGFENLDTVDACITRLRVTVKDASKVNASKLKELGAAGVVGEGSKSIQAIFGGEADVLKSKIKKMQKSLPKEVAK